MPTIPYIKAVMTPFPHAIGPEATVTEALDMMDRHSIHHLPVTSDGRLVGIVSGWDIERALAASGRRELRVAQIMAGDPYVVDLHDRLDRVLLELARRREGCVLVLKEGHLAGIFTTTDACRLYGEHLKALDPSGGDDAA